jgi:flagellar biosynthetic protein FliP
MDKRQALRSYAEMVAGMLAGMALLEPLWPVESRAVHVQALIMATNMSIGMAALMLLRGHGSRRTLTMCAAMYVPFLVLFPSYRGGLIAADTFFNLGHALMLMLMLLLVCRESTQQPTAATKRQLIPRLLPPMLTPSPAPTSEKSSS